jgi:factor associated with neutral sphingomyelinase activation
MASDSDMLRVRVTCVGLIGLRAFVCSAQLETGEKFLLDVAVLHTPPSPAEHHPLPHVKGRLRVCTASLVFEPEPPDLPLLRIPLSKVTCIEPVRASGWALSSPAGSDARFRVQCSSVTSMLANNRPGPYKQHVSDQEHMFTALHSKLESFFPVLMQLLAAARLPADRYAGAMKKVMGPWGRRRPYTTPQSLHPDPCTPIPAA